MRRTDRELTKLIKQVHNSIYDNVFVSRYIQDYYYISIITPTYFTLRYTEFLSCTMIPDERLFNVTFKLDKHLLNAFFSFYRKDIERLNKLKDNK